MAKPNGRARAATACPMRPMPNTPSRKPCKERPNMPVGAQRPQWPLRRACSALVVSRAAATTKNKVRSATASVNTSGVWNTRKPRADAACRSTWSVPTEYVPSTCTEAGKRAMVAASKRSPGITTKASMPCTWSSKRSPMASGASHPTKSNRAWARCRTSAGGTPVINKRGRWGAGLVTDTVGSTGWSLRHVQHGNFGRLAPPQRETLLQGDARHLGFAVPQGLHHRAVGGHAAVKAAFDHRDHADTVGHDRTDHAGEAIDDQRDDRVVRRTGQFDVKVQLALGKTVDAGGLCHPGHHRVQGVKFLAAGVDGRPHGHFHANHLQGLLDLLKRQKAQLQADLEVKPQHLRIGQ